MRTLFAILFLTVAATGLVAVGCAHSNQEKKAAPPPDMSPPPNRPPPAQ
jgi:hypothetical protein